MCGNEPKNHKKYHTEIHTEKLDSAVTPILSVILWVNSLSWLKLLLLSGVPSLIKRKTYFNGNFLLVLSIRFLKQPNARWSQTQRNSVVFKG